MKGKFLLTALSILFTSALPASNGALAQQPQIPTLQVCNETEVEGSGAVFLEARQDAFHSGWFKLEIELRCDPGGVGYPGGGLRMRIDLSDSNVANLQATGFEQVTTTGKHTPTAYMNGRCRAVDESGNRIHGCRFWLMVADNASHDTPDVVGFLVFDGTGKRVSYGTGPLVDGDIFVAPTSF